MILIYEIRVLGLKILRFATLNNYFHIHNNQNRILFLIINKIYFLFS